jgi:hypothetical protein
MVETLHATSLQLRWELKFPLKAQTSFNGLYLIRLLTFDIGLGKYW